MKRVIAFLLILPLVAYADSVKGDKFNLTFNSLIACDSVRLRIGFPDTTATPDTLITIISQLMDHYLTADGENWIYYNPAGIDSLGTLAIDISYYSDGVGEHLAGTWLNIADTLSMQGSASGLTAPGVAHVVIDSMSNRGMIYDGGGNFVYSIYVLDSADSAAISGVTGTLYPDGGTTLSAARRVTGGNGILIYAIDTVAYDLYLHAPGYDYPAHYDYDIAGAGTDTIFLDRFAPTPPPPNMVPIFAWLTTAGGDTINPSKLRYRPLKPDSIAQEILYVYDGDSSYYREYTENEKLNYGSGSNQVVIVKKWTEKSFAQSYLPINLYPNSLLSDTTSVYEFEATYRPPGGRDYIARHVIIAVPDTSAFNPFAQ